MLNKIKTIKELVREILKDNPQTRDDDWKLVFKVWEAQGLMLNKKQQELFKECAIPDSITRIRRELQEAGYYVGTRREERLEEQNKMRDYYAKN